jgi:hypothetical protein
MTAAPPGYRLIHYNFRQPSCQCLRNKRIEKNTPVALEYCEPQKTPSSMRLPSRLRGFPAAFRHLGESAKGITFPAFAKKTNAVLRNKIVQLAYDTCSGMHNHKKFEGA